MIRASRALSTRWLLPALFALLAGCDAGFTARPYHVVELGADPARVQLRPINDAEGELAPVEQEVVLGAPIEPRPPVFNGFQWVEEPGLILFNETQLLAEAANGDASGSRAEVLGAGYAVQFSQRGDGDPASKSLLVVLQGGNGCVAEGACAGTYNFEGLGPGNPDYWELPADKRHPLFVLNARNGGLDETDSDRGELEADLFEDRAGNPFAGWNYAFLPYFSGDNWLGDSRDDVVFFENGAYEAKVIDDRELGDTPRYQFRGVHNVRTILSRLAPTFADVDRVVILGYSAGGTGATYHLERFVRAFEAARAASRTTADGGARRPTFAVIADSAPYALDDDMADGGKIEGLPACLQRRLRNLYRADRGMPVACEDCADNPTGAFSNSLSEYMLRAYPDTPVSIITSPYDDTLQLAFGAGRVARDRDDNLVACGRVDHGVSLQEFLFARVTGFRKKLRDLFDWATNDVRSNKLSVFMVDRTTEPAIKATMNHVWTIRSGFVLGVQNAETGLLQHPTGGALFPCATPGACDVAPAKTTLQNYLRRVVESM